MINLGEDFVSLLDFYSFNDTSDYSQDLISALFEKVKLIHEDNRKVDIIDENNVFVNPNNITSNYISSSPISSYEDKGEIVKKDLIDLYCLAFGLYIFENYNNVEGSYIIKKREVLKDIFDSNSYVIPSEDIEDFRSAIVDGNPSYLSRKQSAKGSSRGNQLVLSNGTPTGIVGNDDIPYSNTKAFGAALFMGLSLLITSGIMAFLAYLLAR